jgi:hypothetical protein
MTELMDHPSHQPHWRAAMNCDPVDWHTLFADYQATVDWPAAFYYEPLMHHFPDAKVILSLRDPERWYQSAYSTVYDITTNRLVDALLAVGSPVIPRLKHIQFVIEWNRRVLWDGLFEGRFEDKDYVMRRFHEQIECVKAQVPPERLLVYSVKDGWEPLCEFLDVPVPEQPFPHVNSRNSFHRIMVLRSLFGNGR